VHSNNDSVICEAFRRIPRERFLLPGYRHLADVDSALPIGYEQTNSQPLTVGRMLRWLSAQPGDRVLDIGCGSGWTSALLSHVVGPKGHVYAVEIVPELLKQARTNCGELGLHQISFHHADPDQLGLLEHAPYDRILVSASAAELPHELIEQLGPAGRMVIPVDEEIFVVQKDGLGRISTEKHGYYLFVSLITPGSAAKETK
jgi:protein-L-isoaspartate(D-aspartate) O-methyltransferase